MILDPNFQYHDGRRGGRTTKMLLDAIELARSPQTIYLVFHDHRYAQDEYNRALSILLANYPDLVWFPKRELRHIWFEDIGSRIILSYASQGPRIVPEIMSRWGAISIMIDHYALEIANTNIVGNNYLDCLAYWDHAIDTIQKLSKENEVQ